VSEAPGAEADADAARLVGEIGDRCVVVRLTDIAPVGSPVYFAEGTTMACGIDGAPSHRCQQDQSGLADVVAR
jgi:hypothetical protein